MNLRRTHAGRKKIRQSESWKKEGRVDCERKRQQKKEGAPMEPSRSRTSPDSAAEEDLSGFGSKQPVYSDLDAKSDLGKKPSQRMQSRAM